MQLREKFLYIVDRAHRRVRIKRYLDGKTPSDFSPMRGENRQEFLLRQDDSYLSWCNEWNDGLDEPSIASNLFIKYMESYKRCHYGVERGNTWLMDVEGCHWLCGWKFVGKQNYATEACYRVDTLFGGKELTPEELEWRRINQLITMTPSRFLNLLDEMNDFEMQWNKG